MSTRRTKAVLIDFGGTLSIGSSPIASCVQALERLRSAKIPFRICTNTSKESTPSLLSKLRGMGFKVHENEIFTSLGACRELLRSKGVKRPYLLLSDSAMEDFASSPSMSEIPSDAAYDAVVIGLAPERLTYEHLNTAFRILAHEHHTSSSQRLPVPFIAIHKSRYLQEKDGLSLGPGGFVAALEYALGKETRAEAVGKPELPFFRMVLESFKRDNIEEGDWKDVAVVGDDVEGDLGGGAFELGLQRVLVKTGKYREGDEHKVLSPDETHDSFATFVDSLF